MPEWTRLALKKAQSDPGFVGSKLSLSGMMVEYSESEVSEEDELNDDQH